MAETVLVTGGAGFLGTHLVQRLLAEGCEVHATSRNDSVSSSDRLTFHRADLANLDAARHLLQLVEPRVVFHLAGSVGAAPDQALVLDTYHSHVTSTLNLLTLADDLDVRRIVLTGSLLEPLGMMAEVIPSSPYAAAKLTTTLYARMFHGLYGTPVVVVRPFMTFGPGQHPKKLLPYVINSFLEGVSPDLSSGEWRADWIYVSDVIDGMVSAMETPGAEGADIDLGRGELTSTKEIVSAVHALMRSPAPLQFGGAEDRPSAPERTADMSAPRELLSWAPRVSIEDGLRQTIEWYQAQKRMESSSE
jgi:UDP-glucose 4-epimerase